MPLLDVSFMTRDAMLSDAVDVRRRLDVVGEDGRVVPTPDTLFADVDCVVTQQDPADLLRTEDGQCVPRRILLVTALRLIALAPGQQPDEVTFDGTVYTVAQVFPYSRFGEGFYEAVAEYRGPVPPPQ